MRHNTNHTRRARVQGLWGFTLIEVLVTVAIIAIMSALLMPAVRGLLGVTGPRGGVNTLSAAVEQARLAAMESGVPAYLGWVLESTNSASSAVIVFRDKREDEPANPSVAPVTRWLKLPQGVFIEPVGSFASTNTGSNLPRLDGTAVPSVSFVKFDRFGRLQPTTQTRVLRVGAKADKDGDFLGDANNYFELAIQPLTGRVVVVDKALEGS